MLESQPVEGVAVGDDSFACDVNILDVDFALPKTCYVSRPDCYVLKNYYSYELGRHDSRPAAPASEQSQASLTMADLHGWAMMSASTRENNVTCHLNG